jgi:hypothetical protein
MGAGYSDLVTCGLDLLRQSCGNKGVKTCAVIDERRAEFPARESLLSKAPNRKFRGRSTCGVKILC